MYYVLYDKDFKALGLRKTYPCSSWSLRRKANEFDELKLEGLAIENDDGAMYVGLHDEYIKLNSMDTYITGTLRTLAFCGIPDTAKGKTKINAIDLRSLLNNDTVIDLTTVATVKGLYYELLTCLFNTSKYGYLNIGLAIDDPILNETEQIPFKEEALERSKEVGNVWKTIQAVNSIYDCYVSVDVDFMNRKISFRVKRIIDQMNIKLSDFSDTKIKRDSTGINRVVCYAEGNYSDRRVYYLLNDDTVVSEQNVTVSKIIHPIKIAVYEEDTLDEARVKGIQELYKNRFKAKIEISLDNQMGYLLRNVDLTYFLNIYEYKKLPVMEVYEDHKNQRKLKIGRLEEYWWV